MKRALALAAILLLPLSTPALTPSRAFVIPGPGGYYGVAEECSRIRRNGQPPGIYTSVLFGPISYRLPCGLTTLALLAILATGLALAGAMAIRGRIEDPKDPRRQPPVLKPRISNLKFQI